MNSLEALEIIIFRLTSHEEDLELRETDKKAIEIIKQDLEHLEVLEKKNVELRQEVSALEDYSYDVDCEKELLIKENEKLKKAFQILTQRIIIKTHKNFLFGGRHLDVANTTMKLTDEEYELLKEVVNNESNNT